MKFVKLKKGTARKLWGELLTLINDDAVPELFPCAHLCKEHRVYIGPERGSFC